MPTPKKAVPGAKPTIDQYIARFDGWRKQVLIQLRDLIDSAAPKATAAIKWSQPVWDDHGPVCYMRVHANHVTLGFWRGAELTAPRGFLDGEGDRMRHIKLTSTDQIRKKLVQQMVREAVKLNRAEGDPTKPRARRPVPKDKSYKAPSQTGNSQKP